MNTIVLSASPKSLNSPLKLLVILTVSFLADMVTHGPGNFTIKHNWYIHGVSSGGRIPG